MNLKSPLLTTLVCGSLFKAYKTNQQEGTESSLWNVNNKALIQLQQKQECLSNAWILPDQTCQPSWVHT